MKVFIVGCGRVGRVLIALLEEAGIGVVGGSTRTESGADRARSITDATIHVSTVPEIPAETDVVWLTTPDSAIEACSHALWTEGKILPETILLHASGALPASILRRGAPGVQAVARAHPLQSFSGNGDSLDLARTAYWFIEGETAGCKIAGDLLECARIKTHPLPGDAGAAYHAAATLASNALVALASIASKTAAQAGLPQNTALQILLPLMRGTLENLETQGLPDALTGPIARGDFDIVRSHLQFLDETNPDHAKAYRALAKEIIVVAENQGKLGREEISRLRATLLTPEPNRDNERE